MGTMSKQSERHRRIPLRRPQVRAAINMREMLSERHAYQGVAR